MIKKIICIGIISMFLLTNVTVLSAFEIVTKASNTIIVPDDYSTIQEAINAANEGDTIFVHDGTYYRFTANKRVNIIGESRQNTIVMGNRVKLTSNGVSLSTFTLKGLDPGIEYVLDIE